MADYPVTLARSACSTLSLQEGVKGFTHKYTISYTDVAVATATLTADTVTVTIGGALPSLYKVRAAGVNVTTAFAGTTAMTIACGTTGSTAAFVTAQSVLAAGWKNGVPALTSAVVTATATSGMVAVFTNATGGSPSALTAGSCDIYLAIDNNAAGMNG